MSITKMITLSTEDMEKENDCTVYALQIILLSGKDLFFHSKDKEKLESILSLIDMTKVDTFKEKTFTTKDVYGVDENHDCSTILSFKNFIS